MLRKNQQMKFIIKKTIFPKQKKVMILVALFITTALVLFIAVVVSASVILSKSQDSNMNINTDENLGSDEDTTVHASDNITITSTVKPDFTEIPTGTASSNLSLNISCTDSHSKEYKKNCDFRLVCGESVHNWREVADLKIDVNGSCPEPWTFDSNKKGCSSYKQCSTSVVFPVPGGEYSRVCGRVMGSATGKPNAFRTRTRNENHKIEYDGLGLRVNNSREHIWAYAVGSSRPNSNCPCYGTDAPQPLPNVGVNYYCDDSENTTLWDQNYCGVYDKIFTSSTWFHARVSSSTTSGIEAIICTNQPEDNENFFVKMIQLYVK